MPTETDAEFEQRKAKWYRELQWQGWAEALVRAVPYQDRLWATAERVVLARVERVGRIRLRGQGHWYRSPLVTLRPVEWLKGRSSARRLQVHYLSADTCSIGGAGHAPYGEVGEVFLLFYKPGRLSPRNILTTIGKDYAASPRTREAFGLPASLESSLRPPWEREAQE